MFCLMLEVVIIYFKEFFIKDLKMFAIFGLKFGSFLIWDFRKESFIYWIVKWDDLLFCFLICCGIRNLS